VAFDFLIVDDSAIMRETVGDFCIELAHTAATVENGSKAIEAVRKKAWDCVFLDVHLPDMDGREILKQIHELRPDQKVVLMTSDRGNELFEEACQRKNNLRGFINKPFDIDVFENCLKTVIVLKGIFTHRKEGYR